MSQNIDSTSIKIISDIESHNSNNDGNEIDKMKKIDASNFKALSQLNQLTTLVNAIDYHIAKKASNQYDDWIDLKAEAQKITDVFNTICNNMY